MSLLLSNAFALLSLVLLFGSFVASQTTHVVQVGADGSFYNPSTISAQLNDTVTFVFVGAAHSVTQCAFETPCVPLQGGFNSGIAGIGSNTSASPPSWDLVITNVSQPIWFFCQSTVPSSHCSAGMVGVINPPSISRYDQFVAAAKFVSGTPVPSPSLTLKGVGAFATNSPAPTQTPSGSTSDTVTSTSSFPSSTPTPSPSSTTETTSPTADASTSQPTFEAHKGGIIAGIVVGAIVVIVLLMVLYFYLKRQRDKATIKDFFSYTVPPPQNMSNRSGSQLMLALNNNRHGGTPPAQPSNGLVTVIPRRPSNEYNFSSGFGRGHAYANVGLENKDPYATSDVTSSDTYGTDSTVVSGAAAAARLAPRRKPSRDRGHEETRHPKPSATAGGDIQQKPSESPPQADQKLPDAGDSHTREPSPPPPPVYRS